MAYASNIGLRAAGKTGLYKPKKPKSPWAGLPASVQPAMDKTTPPTKTMPAPQSSGLVTTPHADPFYNPQNQMDLANVNYDTSTGIADIDGALRNLATQTAYQETQIDDGARKATSATNDNAAARGISRSSIRDGGLADIEAQRVLQKNYLEDQLSTAKITADAKKAALTTHATGYIKGLDAQAVANADEINKQIQPDPRASLSPALQAATITTPQGQVRIDPTRWISNSHHVRGKDGYIYKVNVYGDGHKERIRVGK